MPTLVSIINDGIVKDLFCNQYMIPGWLKDAGVLGAEAGLSRSDPKLVEVRFSLRNGQKLKVVFRVEDVRVPWSVLSHVAGQVKEICLRSTINSIFSPQAGHLAPIPVVSYEWTQELHENEPSYHREIEPLSSKQASKYTLVFESGVRPTRSSSSRRLVIREADKKAGE